MSSGDKKKAKQARNAKARAAIIEQSILKEVQVNSINRVKLSRVRYQDNPRTFIDFRLFQRGWDDEGEEIYHPTSKGIQMKEKDFLALVEGAFFEGLDSLIEKDPR